LVAYLVMRPEALVTASALREWLRSKLPDYMLPSAFVQVESFPMTPNGKVDRAALPAPDASNMLRDAPSPEPFTAIEIEVAEIVATLLELESVSRDDNFFLLGGHSLLGTQLITRIRGVFGVEVSLASLFDNPTVRGIAAEIDRLTSAAEEIFLKNESSTSPEAPAP
jgi:acyl carrier protein